jgi:RTX calcium-binding nonapeptide repeat (4 copies)
VIVGGAGNDIIFGDTGDDRICAAGAATSCTGGKGTTAFLVLVDRTASTQKWRTERS